MSDCSGKNEFIWYRVREYGTKKFLFQLNDDDLRQLDCV